MKSRRDYEETLLSSLLGKYQDAGIVVYGQIESFPGTYAKLLVKSDGTVKIEGITTISGTVDVSDRAGRLLGIIYGSQGQQVQQRAVSYDLYTAIRQGGAELSLTNALFTDEIDRAARLLGRVYGSQGQQLSQRATTYELMVQLAHQGTEYDARQTRALTASDIVTAQQATRTSLKAQTEREDLTRQGGTYSPNNSSVSIVTAVAGQKIKLWRAAYHAAVDGLHYLYFGTSPTPPSLPSSKVLLMSSKAGHYRESFTQPEPGAASEALYLFSAVSETSMPCDVGFVQEA